MRFMLCSCVFASTHQNPLNVLDANNMYLLLKNMFKIIKVVANLELMPI